jgi:phosphohistidine phosphatase
MKVLYLLRHAKSSWDDPHLPDHDRPLAPRGTRAARKLADHVRRARIAPALVLCSTALRATQTLDVITGAFAATPEVRLENELYGASTEELVDRLREVSHLSPSVLLIGHNPGIQSVAVRLAIEDAALVARLRDKMPTGALATLELGGDWSEVSRASARLVSFVTPRELP